MASSTVVSSDTDYDYDSDSGSGSGSDVDVDVDMSPPTSPNSRKPMGPPPTREPSRKAPKKSNNGEVGGSSKSVKRKKRKLRSKIWIDFTRYKDKDRKPRAYCHHCFANYAAHPTRNGTSTLKKHLLKCLKYPPNVKKALSQTLDSFVHSTTGTGGDGVDSRVLRNQWKLDLDVVRKALTEMIIMDELPFIFVENEGFRKFMEVVCPQFVVPSRSTITRDCLDLYRDHQQKLRAHFHTSTQMVCLTTDMWTSNQRLSYMCLTAHFIDDDWKLCKRILNFIPCPSHKGDEVGILIEKCLAEWSIKRIFTCTVDNASSNDNTVKFLADRYGERGMTPLRGRVFHMRCVAHIINLVVRDGLAEIGLSVDRIRMVVKYVRQSPARLEKFRVYAMEEGIEITKVLCLDVPTRWNSTFYMLQTALLYQKAFDRYAICDPHLKAMFSTGGIHEKLGLPEREDWTAAIKLLRVLKHFESLTRRVSGTAYVTSNRFLDEINDACGIIRDLTLNSDKELSKMAHSMKTKFDKYWGNVEKMNVLLFIPTILDPRKKLGYVDYILTYLYGASMGLTVFEKTSQCLEDLYREYKNHYAPPPREMPGGGMFDQGGPMDSSILTEDDQEVLERRHALVQAMQMREHMGVGEKSELHKYLEESKETLVAAVNDKFDILGWWKMNVPRFPILSRLARDIFAIPISTVASESCFSTGGRIISDFRSSLTPYSAQALICTQDWLRETPIYSIEETLETLTLIEKGSPQVPGQDANRPHHVS